jgi:hypothetical protein
MSQTSADIKEELKRASAQNFDSLNKANALRSEIFHRECAYRDVESAMKFAEADGTVKFHIQLAKEALSDIERLQKKLKEVEPLERQAQQRQMEQEQRRLAEQRAEQERKKREAQEHQLRAEFKQSINPGASAESLTKRGFQYLEDSEWANAIDYFDSALDKDPEYVPTWVGKLCAELEVASETELVNSQSPLADNPNFKKAVRYADDDCQARLEGYARVIQERIAEQERLERERKAEQARLAEEKRQKEEQKQKQEQERLAEERRIAEERRKLIGTEISFGGYIWQVLDIQNDNALIITNDIIEMYAIDKCEKWTDSELRKYLNEKYYEKFNECDRAKIVQVLNKNADNQWFGTDGGADTEDSVFLLSLDEVMRYFGDSSAELQNASTNTEFDTFFDDGWIDDKNNNTRVAKYEGEAYLWWLRSPGSGKKSRDTGRNGNLNAFVSFDGLVFFDGYYHIGNTGGGIRPALWLNLSLNSILQGE